MKAKAKKDSLGDRMKKYEAVPRSRLTRRTPVLMRLDGKAFHTFTKNMPRPYYRAFHECMWAAAKHLCENIQGAKVAYVQSDEITLLVTDYAALNTEAFFDYQVQKMCSVAAAMCTAAFMRELLDRDENPAAKLAVMDLPAFDCRVWNMPKDEVVNCFIWRQQDATRNAIQMLGQAHFSHKQLHKLSCANIQEKLFQEKGINFNDCPVPQKRGVCIVKEQFQLPVAGWKPGDPEVVWRTRWVVDENIPIFTQDRQYIQRYVDPCSATSSSATPTPSPTT